VVTSLVVGAFIYAWAATVRLMRDHRHQMRSNRLTPLTEGLTA